MSIKNTKISSDSIFEIFISFLSMKTALQTDIRNAIYLQLRQKMVTNKTKPTNQK